MKNMAKQAGSFFFHLIEGFVFAVGLFTIYGYVEAKWPIGWRFGSVIFCGVAALAFIWRVVVIPFREGYRILDVRHENELSRIDH